MDLSLHPYCPFKAAAGGRLAIEVFFVDAEGEFQVITVNDHDIHFLQCIRIPGQPAVYDLAKNVV
jgi:hypothetical protein